MNPRPFHENLGEPALRIAGFQLWIHGREFPESDDYNDGNWLRATAHCGAAGASIFVQGAIVTVMDVAGFAKQCAAMHRGESSSATLDPWQPELKVSLEAKDKIGHIRARIEITPDQLVQRHRFDFEIDQSYLPGIVEQCLAIVEEQPIRGL